MVNPHIATYSKVEVFESIINNMPLMRRRSDDWVNATQILKIAGLGKAQRTRILEREIHKLQHQKIQGGYGRFQGTWVPLDVARSLADKHSFTKDQVKVLYYDPEVDGPLQRLPTSNKSSTLNPANKKRKSKSENTSTRPTKKSHSPASKANPIATGLTQTPVPSFGPLPTSSQLPDNLPPTFGTRQYSVPSQSSNQLQHQVANPKRFSVPSQLHLQSQQTGQFHQQHQIHNTQPSQAQPEFQPQSQPQQHNYSTGQDANGLKQLQHQQARYAAMYNQVSYQLSKRPSQINQYSHNNYGSMSTTDGSHEEIRLNRSDSDTSASADEFPQPPSQPKFNYQQQQHFIPTHIPTPQSSQPPSHHQHTQQQEPQTDVETEDPDYYTDRLISYFSSDNVPIPEFLYNPPDDFDINRPIDNEGHTPLHWASALASLNAVHILISKGADPLVLNKNGMNCLSKLIHFTNSYDMKNFQGILHLLRQCLIVPDSRGRTPLHYLTDLTSLPNKFNCLSYYFTEIVTFIEFQQREAEKVALRNSDGIDKGESKNLLKILISHKDKEGNTALHLALKGGVRWFIKSLLQFGADADSVGAENIPSDILKELELENRLAAGMQPFTPGELMVSPATESPPTPAKLQFPVQRYHNTAKQGITNANIFPQTNVITKEEPSMMDISENKENIFEPQDVSMQESTPKASVKLERTIKVASTPNQSTSKSDTEDDSPIKATKDFRTGSIGDSIRNFKEKLPSVLASLNEKFDEELAEKNDEIEHNNITLSKISKEVELLQKKSSHLLQQIFKDDDEVDYRTFLNSNDSLQSKQVRTVGLQPSFHGTESLDMLLQDKLINYRQEFEEKSNILVSLYERSQALELAKSVNNEEMKITSEIEEDKTPESKAEAGKLAVELTLLQIGRRKLISSIIAFTGGSVSSTKGSDTSFLDDDNDDFDYDSSISIDDRNTNIAGLALLKKEQLDERRSQAKLYLYKKLISNICDLPMDEIDQDLLNGIETRLLEGGKAGPVSV